MRTSLLVQLFAVICIVHSDEVNDATLRFYYRSFKEFKEFNLRDATKIFNSPWYDTNRTTVFFAHGFKGRPDGPAVTSVITSYLEQNKSNVILLNWEHLAASTLSSIANSYINWAAPNARKLGVRFADTLRNLSAAGLNLDNTHLVGHSLGAHIFGITGNSLREKGILLPWITGLDPAAIGFEGRPLNTRLNVESAGFVAVIHSDPSKYGFSRQMGTVDFWPNYRNGRPARQPGCGNRPSPMFSPEDLCNHNRCWELLIDSLKHPGLLLASYARNYRTWKNYSKEERNAVVLEIGTYYKKPIPGNYYFVTKAETPYGLGIDGL